MLELNLENMALRFSDDEWCAVTLVQRGEETVLGAENRKTLLCRLHEAFINPGTLKSSVIVNGVRRFWCLTLSEIHVSIHISEQLSNNTRILYLFDEFGKKIIELRLPNKIIDDWASEIANTLFGAAT